MNTLLSWGYFGLPFVCSYGTNSMAMRLTIMKFVYLVVGIAGMVGTLIIVFKAIYLTSISDLDMVLIFSLDCLSIIVLWAGFYGFHELTKIPDEQKRNVIQSGY